jgi:hypothetical protein
MDEVSLLKVKLEEVEAERD